MKKFLFGFLLLIAAAGGVAWMQRVSLVSKALSKATEMEASVTDVSFFPLTLQNFHLIDARTETDLKVGTLIVDTPLSSLFSDPVKIDTLTLRGLTLQSKLGGFNIHKPSTYLQFFKSSSESTPPKTEGKKVAIETLIVEKVDIQVANPFSKKDESIRLRVPELTLKNPGEMTVDQLIELLKTRL